MLDTQTNVQFTARREKKTFTINTPTAFGVYRLEITANASGTPGMRVAKYELLDKQGANLTQDHTCLDDHPQ